MQLLEAYRVVVDRYGCDKVETGLISIGRMRTEHLDLVLIVLDPIFKSQGSYLVHFLTKNAEC